MVHVTEQGALVDGACVGLAHHQHEFAVEGLPGLCGLTDFLTAPACRRTDRMHLDGVLGHRAADLREIRGAVGGDDLGATVLGSRTPGDGLGSCTGTRGNRDQILGAEFAVEGFLDLGDDELQLACEVECFTCILTEIGHCVVPFPGPLRSGLRRSWGLQRRGCGHWRPQPRNRSRRGIGHPRQRPRCRRRLRWSRRRYSP